MDIKKELFNLQDKEYAKFQAGLTPGIPVETFIGVRLPLLRKLAVRFEKTPECEQFLQQLPHEYYDENILHSILISRCREYDKCIALVNDFLPYVDNWAVCDTLRPKIFEKNKEALMPHVKEWSASKEVYTCRFGVDMLMTYYLDDDFLPEYFEIPLAIRSEEYYVNMMIAWYFATALAKQWDTAVKVIEDKRLAGWTHNKTIQKARESYRITDEQKEYLKALKVKL